LYKDKPKVFIHNPQWQAKLNEEYTRAFERLKAFLEVVKGKIEYRQYKESKQNGAQDKSPILSSIFKKPEYYQKCIEILHCYEASALTAKKGYILFAIIDAMKDKSETIFHKNYRDEDLLPLFNSHLNKGYSQLKRNAKDFKRIKAEVKQMLSNL
jgi:hypothetical protein